MVAALAPAALAALVFTVAVLGAGCADDGPATSTAGYGAAEEGPVLDAASFDAPATSAWRPLCDDADPAAAELRRRMSDATCDRTPAYLDVPGPAGAEVRVVSVVADGGQRRLFRGLRGGRAVRVGPRDPDAWMRADRGIDRAGAQALMEAAMVRSGVGDYVLTREQRSALERIHPSLRTELAAHPPGVAEIDGEFHMRVWFAPPLGAGPCPTYSYRELRLTPGEAPIVGPAHAITVACTP
jgi:hypothetical protein